MKYKNNPLITGTIVLTLTGFLSRIIGFFYRIFLANLFGEEGMGIYQMTAPVLALSFSLTAAGLQTAVSKFVAGETTTHDYKYSFRILVTGFVLSFSFSLLCGYVVYTYAEPISSNLLLEPRCAPLLRIIALSIPFSAVHSIANGYFYGIKSTKIPAFTQLAEQLVRVGSVYLIYLAAIKRGMTPTISLAVTGMVIGEIVSMCISVAAIYIRFYAKGLLQNSGEKIRHYSASFHFPVITKQLLFLSFPLTLNRIVINLLQSVEAIYIPECLRLYGLTTKEALSVYGVLTGMALPLILFPSALTGSVSVLLLPVVAEAEAAGNRRTISRAITKSISYCFFFGVFCAAFFLLFGQMAGELLFHSKMAGNFIITLSFICPFLYITSTLSSILNGLGKTMSTFLFNLISLGIRLFFIFLFVPLYGIKGYLWGLLASHIFLTAALILRLRKFYCAKVDAIL